MKSFDIIIKGDVQMIWNELNLSNAYKSINAGQGLGKIQYGVNANNQLVMKGSALLDGDYAKGGFIGFLPEGFKPSVEKIVDRNGYSLHIKTNGGIYPHFRQDVPTNRFNELVNAGRCHDISVFSHNYGSTPSTFATHGDETEGYYSIQYKAPMDTTSYKGVPVTLKNGQSYIALAKIKSLDGLNWGRVAVKHSAGYHNSSTNYVSETVHTLNYATFVADGTESSVGIYLNSYGISDELNNQGIVFDELRLFPINSSTKTDIDNGVYTDAQLEELFPYTDGIAINFDGVVVELD